MGRPPKKKSEVRNSIVTVRMNEVDHRRLHKDAEKADQSVSAYLIQCWKRARK